MDASLMLCGIGVNICQGAIVVSNNLPTVILYRVVSYIVRLQNIERWKHATRS